MKFCYNTNSTLPKQCQSSRSILQDGSRTFGLFWKEKTPSYNRRNTVIWLLGGFYSSLPQHPPPHTHFTLAEIQGGRKYLYPTYMRL